MPIWLCFFIFISIFRIRFNRGLLTSSLFSFKRGIIEGIALFRVMVALLCKIPVLLWTPQRRLFCWATCRNLWRFMASLVSFLIYALSYPNITGAVMIDTLCVTVLSRLLSNSHSKAYCGLNDYIKLLYDQRKIIHLHLPSLLECIVIEL